MITYEQIEKIVEDVTTLGEKVQQLKKDVTQIIGDIENIDKLNQQIAKDKEIITHDVVYLRKLEDILRSHVMKQTTLPDNPSPSGNLQIHSSL